MCRTPEFQTFVSRALTLFPEDTVLGALQQMYRHGVQVLPVVEGRGGDLLGEVTEDELHRVARRRPLARLAEILTVKALAAPEETTVEPVAPLRLAASSGWLH
ncbi:CBS domain-containing protein [Corallococcus terminator]|uniref:CBS domain-containing protein n=1 Tax=Corallococcus terminator TaxID=2316733 RepID=A0A3A8I1I1_9BACT|nr:CBS domain-containing protein [Corallococcus terminator]RKG77317.1 CBS domain-containing protein [Corallococcus terminator]